MRITQTTESLLELVPKLDDNIVKIQERIPSIAIPDSHEYRNLYNNIKIFIFIY